MPLPVRLCCSNNQGRCCHNLYIICVIVARILADYLLVNLIELLIYFADLDLVPACAIVYARDSVSGICGVIGAILVDVYLTNYGLIFISSLLYGVGLICIVRGYIGDDYNLTFLLVGIYMTGTGNLSLMNSSNALAKEQRDTIQSNTSFLTNFVEYLCGKDTHTSRHVRDHGYAILLILIKYTAKIMFVVAIMVLGHIFENDPKVDVYLDAFDTGQYLVPTAAVLLTAVISLVKVRSFLKPVEDRHCTPFKHVISVCTTAFSKRSLQCPQNSTLEILYQGSPEHPLPHTNSLRFLDKAAIIDPSQHRSQQTLCTVTEVEETKCLLRMVPMCMTFLLYGMVKSVGNTFFLIQGHMMDPSIGKNKIQVPLQTLIIIGDISGLLTKGLYIILISKRLTGSGMRYGSPIKYAIGLVLATFCCTVASWIAADKRKNDSVFWLTPQFLLFGAMSEVTRDGIQTFFHEQLPPSVRRYYSVITDAIIGTGAILCTALVCATRSSLDESPEIFYRRLTVVCFIILSAYTFVASRYRYQDNKEAQSDQEIHE